jgi:LPXTG-motif cell wall-anchored protein
MRGTVATGGEAMSWLAILLIVLLVLLLLGGFGYARR